MKKFIGNIEKISVSEEEGKFYFSGYSFIEGVNISKSNNIKKSLILSKDEKKYYVPMENICRNDITERFGKNKYNYNYSGFSGFIDVEFIDNMSILDVGMWSLSIYINTSVIEAEYRLGYEESLKSNDHDDFNLFFSKLKKHLKVNLYDNRVYIDCKKEDINYKNIPISKKKKNNDNRIKVKRFIDIGFKYLYNITKNLKIKENRVVFLSDSRDDFTGNFEFIYKELVNRGGYDIRYILKHRIDAPKSIKDKLKFIYYISTSKYILLDDYYPQIYKYDIKKDIEVIQLWHACGAFKTFGFSRMGKVGGPNSKSRNHKNYTKAIVSSNDIKKHYAEAFGISEYKVIATGVPRTDIFFDEEYKNNKIKEIYKKYPMLRDKKVILFAPTFRGSGQKNAHYDFNKLNIDKLRNELGNNYIIIMKLHPFIKDIIKITEENRRFIIDLSNEREINDLLFVSDILITDYSSVCFEYSLLNRPMIFFAYDLDEYIASRDFYYPYESFVPGPIAKTTDDILNIIKEDNFEREKLNNFRNKFFDHFDGKSTKRVVDMLINIDDTK